MSDAQLSQTPMEDSEILIRKPDSPNKQETEVITNQIEATKSYQPAQVIENPPQDQEIPSDKSKATTESQEETKVQKEEGKKQVEESQPSQIKLVSQLSFPNRDKLARTILEVIHKKKESFNLLKTWEIKKEALLSEQKGLIESIRQRLSIRLKASRDGMDCLIKFFKDRLKQEETIRKALTSINPQLESNFSHEKDLESWTLPAALKELEAYHAAHAKKVVQMAEFLDKHILNELLLPERKEFEVRIDDLFKVYAGVKEDSLKRAEKKNEAIRDYVELYQQHQIYKRLDQDLHWKEIEYVTNALEELRFNERFGKIIMGYMKDVKALETKRYDVVKKAVISYIEKAAEIYGKEYCEPQRVLKFLEKFESVAENNKVFSVESMLSPDEQNLIKSKFPGIETLTFKEVYECISKINYDWSFEFPLVVKYWDIGLTVADKKMPDLVTIVTDYDNNVLVLKDGLGSMDLRVPEFRIRFKNMLITRDEENSPVLEFIEKKTRILFEEIKKFRFEFANVEEKKLFVELFEQYSNLM